MNLRNRAKEVTTKFSSPLLVALRIVLTLEDARSDYPESRLRVACPLGNLRNQIVSHLPQLLRVQTRRKRLGTAS